MTEVIVLVPGNGSGPALVLTEPLSLWGGLDSATGMIIDQSHPQHGRSIADTVLVMPGGRGSSGGSSVLAEAIRAGVGPAAIILNALDPILCVGGIVVAELYPDQRIPIVVADPATYDALSDGDEVAVRNGKVSRR